jgi:hypothetical protein
MSTMRNTRRSAAVVGLALGVCIASAAFAADPSSIMGKWVERFPNGAGMVTEFTPEAIAYASVDKTGQPEGSPKKTPATYKDLGGDLVGVQFPGSNGSGIMLQRTGPDSLTMDFPGMGMHKLTRFEAP